MSGYSGTPLAQKLGIKPGAAVGLWGAPEDFQETLDGLPEGVCFSSVARGKSPLDVLVVFVRSQREFAARLGTARERMAPAAGLWIAWPKKASGIKTDITETHIRDVALTTDLVDNKVCAIDDTWSGLRLVIRLQHRSGATLR
ncbi:MAG: DUF3052 family protein [Planctomycetes bacterium]|nr:DUF3052 family protein [Planctomycetota bacterium]